MSRVRIDKVITRGGDGGQTSLGDGARVSKESVRIAAMGEVDEANAALGLLRRELAPWPEREAEVARMQNDLFDLGADLCRPGLEGARLPAAAIAWLQATAMALNAGLPPLASFVLPGGTEAAARAHLARAIVRRAERAVVRLHQAEAVNAEILRYLNRLSDYLFILARALNAAADGDVLWRPGGKG